MLEHGVMVRTQAAVPGCAATGGLERVAAARVCRSGAAVVARHWGQQIREGRRAGADRPRDLAGSDAGSRGGAGAGLEAAEGSGRRGDC
jgi:hypothetical protein